MPNWRSLMTGLFAVIFSAGAVMAETDPLPSWKDGAIKKSITDFVAHATTEGPDFVPAPERIAVFDNDGTLWMEQPFYFQLGFAFDRIKTLAPHHPEWKDRQPFKGLIEGDLKSALATGEKGLLEVLATTHAGMTTDDFRRTVVDWTQSAHHPRFKRPYIELVYQPMLELMRHLRTNGFKTFIVSGGGVEFMRVFAEQVYDIPSEQVVGSSGVVKFQRAANGSIKLIKEAKVEFIDDNDGKPVGINRFIGRRPIFAFGNSDGDHAMLQYTAAGAGPRFLGLVHHTDAEREYAYDRQSHIGKLDKALDEARERGWTVVDMKRDWKVVFPHQTRPAN